MGLGEAQADLVGKFAVVVGGAFGIGRAITLAFADAGLAVATFDSDADASRAIVAEAEARGARILSVPGDVRDVDALDRFYDRVEAEFDRIDIVVNVAGGARRRSFVETARDEVADAVRLNYGYVMDSVRRAIPLIRRGGSGGSIINFTTIEAHRGAAGYSVYAGAKAATTNFSRAMAVELAAERIRVNLIAPDTTPSRGNMSGMDPSFMARFDALSEHALAQCYRIYIPQKEPPTEDDIANAALFLASNLSRAITGTTLHVDGGTMASSGFVDWPFGDGFGPAPMAGTLGQLFDAAGGPAATGDGASLDSSPSKSSA